MKLFPLTRGMLAKVDDDVYESLCVLNKKWQASKRSATWYAVTDVDRVRHYMHRFVMQLRPGDSRWIDHADGDGLNNQRANLRVVEPRENALNQQNRVCFGRTGFRGVSSVAGQETFRAYTYERGSQVSIGVWPTIALAACGRDIYVRRFAPRSVLNFPGGPPHPEAEVNATKLVLPPPASGHSMVRAKAGKWEAWIRINGKRKYLGRRDTREEAIELQRAQIITS